MTGSSILRFLSSILIDAKILPSMRIPFPCVVAQSFNYLNSLMTDSATIVSSVTDWSDKSIKIAAIPLSFPRTRIFYSSMQAQRGRKGTWMPVFYQTPPGKSVDSADQLTPFVWKTHTSSWISTSWSFSVTVIGLGLTGGASIANNFFQSQVLRLRA